MKTRWLGILFFTLLSCAQNPNSDCAQNRLRALLDVGSGSTKLTLGEVSLCGPHPHMVQVLDDESSVAVPFEDGKDSKGALSVEIQEAGLKAIAELRDKAFAVARDKAPAYKSIEFAAVGTHAFRTSTNPGEFSAKVRALGINLVPLSQDKEGETAFLGAKDLGLPDDCHGRSPIVWDVGGGSQQITFADKNGQIHVIGLSLGAESFKRKLKSELHSGGRNKNCEAGNGSPNPIGWKNSNRAESIAEEVALNSIDKKFQPSNVTQCFVGVGGVHGKAIEAQASKYWSRIRSCTCGDTLNCEHTPNSYSRKELQCLALFLSDKSDCDAEIKGPYSTTAVSSLYLILGFMQYLKINQIHTLHVSMGTALALDTTVLHWTEIPIPGVK